MDSQTIGQLLKKSREARHLSLQNVADRTRIKMTFLKAMEEGDLAAFDAPIYARNFIRTYARFLKIDESQIMPLLEESPLDRTDDPGRPLEQPPTAPSPPATEPSPRTGSSSAILAIAGVLAVLGGMYLFKAVFFRVARETPPPEPNKIAEETAPANPIEPEGTTPVAGHVAKLRALEDVWMFWEADGQEVEKILGAGEVVNVTFSNRLRIRIGNTNGLTFVLDGEEIPVHTEKVYDKIFRTLENGRLSVESPRGRELQRFRSKTTAE